MRKCTFSMLDPRSGRTFILSLKTVYPNRFVGKNAGEVQGQPGSVGPLLIDTQGATALAVPEGRNLNLD